MGVEKFHAADDFTGELCVLASDFDRILAERDALQSRLNSVEGENDRLRTTITAIRNHTSVSLNQIEMIDQAMGKKS